MANFRVVACNSGCCAVKHIRDFPTFPHQSVYIAPDGHDEDTETCEPSAYDNWMYNTDEFKSGYHNAGTAFRLIVEYIKDRRPSGIITVNLVSGVEACSCTWCDGSCDTKETTYDHSQQEAWSPILEELGFTCQSVVNSNSDNIVHHWTCVYGDVK